jgi:hypothetical protein
MVLQNGQFFAEQIMIAFLQAGKRAVTPVINYDLCRRYEYGVSLRKPSRKCKVSYSVSKGGTTLSIRGCGVVPVKEGHAATRERWTPNTMVTSSLARAKKIPPLELMYRAFGGGERMAPHLEKIIPPWAPWLTGVTGPKGSYRGTDVLTYIEKVLES